MRIFLPNSFLKKRRAISQILGSLIVLGLVSSLGSVILFQGMDKINAFSYDLSNHDKAKNDAFREDLLFENVKFKPNTNQLLIHVGNIGTVESTIVSITAVKIDTQELILNWKDANSTILIDDYVLLNNTATLSQSPNIWNSTTYSNSDYKISLKTSNGNFFTTVARPFNT
jgi:hypothetical protein